MFQMVTVALNYVYILCPALILSTDVRF